MSQFKPGDLALIVNSRTVAGELLIGKCVELVMRIAAGEKVFFDGMYWRPLDADGWIVSGDSLLMVKHDGSVVQNQFCMFAEKNLIPLRGDFAPEQQKSREVVL